MIRSERTHVSVSFDVSGVICLVDTHTLYLSTENTYISKQASAEVHIHEKE